MLRETYAKRYDDYLAACYREVDILMRSVDNFIRRRLPAVRCKSDRLIFNLQWAKAIGNIDILKIELNEEKYTYQPSFWSSECFLLADEWMRVKEKATVLANGRGGKSYEIKI